MLNPNRPSFVTAAAGLLWLSAAIAALFAIAASLGLLPLKFPGGAVVLPFITAAFLALCAVKIGLGRNWARWALLVFFVLGFMMLPFAATLAPQSLLLMPMLLIVYGLIQSVIQLAALVLVFMRASGIWFRPALG